MFHKYAIIFQSVVLLITNIHGSNIIEKDFTSLFRGFDGTVVIYDQTRDTYIVHNQKRANTRFTPFSTFKIPNSLIALETGVITDIDKQYQWDSARYPAEQWWPEQWKQKNSLRSAIKHSVVPFYRSIASEVNHEKMIAFIKRFEYGNMDISSGIDNFWLDGSIAISAMEQVQFLKKFYHNNFSLSESTIKSVKTVLIQEETAKFRLSAKTGGGSLKNDPQKALGWYVGYIEKGKSLYFFAINIDGKSIADIKDSRIEIARSVFSEMNVIEQEKIKEK